MARTHSNVSMQFVVEGEGGDREIALTQDIVKIGKLASSHLRLDHESVSRMHAVIEVASPDEVYVVDLGSVSGTTRNGARINKARIAPGDVLGFGDVHVRVVAMELAQDRVEVTPNPFVASVTHEAVDANDASDLVSTDDVRYGILASGPPVSAADVETSSSSLQVTVMWGESEVLHVAHLTPPRSFSVGESTASSTPDFLVGAELLGRAQLPIVRVENGVFVAVPLDADGSARVGDEDVSFDALRADGRITRSATDPSLGWFSVGDGSEVVVRHRGLTYIVKPTMAGRAVGMEEGFRLSPTQLAWGGLSFLFHAAFLAMFYLMPPRPSALALDMNSNDTRLVQYLMRPSEMVPEILPTPATGAAAGGSPGERAAGDDGAAGDQNSPRTDRRMAVRGPRDNQSPAIPPPTAESVQRTSTILGLERVFASLAPTSAFALADAQGRDDADARGALFGDLAGDNHGSDGLGMIGPGRGGGGDGPGAGLLPSGGGFATRGNGGHDSGYGRPHAGGLRGREGRVPTISPGVMTSTSSMSAESIRRTVRRHINEVRFCYEQRLSSRPDLQGRVTVSFVISGEGTVQSSVVSASTLNDATVEGCVSAAVRRWSFPAPEGGGVVGVSYPFVFAAQ